MNIHRPRIGIDVSAAINQGGGIGRYTRELVQALAKEDSLYDFRLFSAKQPAVLPVPDPIPTSSNVVYREAPFSQRWLYRIWYRLQLPLPLQWFTGELDLFHSPDFTLPPVTGNIPTLLTVHDLSFLHYPATFTPSLVSYLNRVVPRSIRRATHILADSQVTKNDLVELWNVSEEKVTVLHSGVSEAFRPVADKSHLELVRRKYNLGQQPYLFSVSTLQPRKNYQFLIRAFRPIADKYPHNLVIAGGKGWMYQQITAEIKKQELEDRVKLIGFADDSDLPSLYSEAALFVFPSLYEGFGLPLLEAMACGVPVITSDASSLPEVAGDAALLVSPHLQEDWSHLMVQLLRDPDQRKEMVAAGFLQARRFTWKLAARKLLDIYRKLL
jgi:glycosyltransferase involved in cell wall biosynthesis